jgi:hypothetical protein
MGMFDQIFSGQPDTGATSGPGAGLSNKQKLLTGLFGGQPTKHTKTFTPPPSHPAAAPQIAIPAAPAAGGYSAAPLDPYGSMLGSMGPIGTAAPMTAGGYSAAPADPYAQFLGAQRAAALAGQPIAGNNNNPGGNNASALNLAKLLGVDLGKFGMTS